MYQQEIQFFWPLTEQIPLDLDFSNCQSIKVSYSVGGAGGTGSPVNFNGACGGGGNIGYSTYFNIDEGNMTINVKEQPSFLRKCIYKLIGFKWEIK